MNWRRDRKEEGYEGKPHETKQKKKRNTEQKQNTEKRVRKKKNSKGNRKNKVNPKEGTEETQIRKEVTKGEETKNWRGKRRNRKENGSEKKKT